MHIKIWEIWVLVCQRMLLQENNNTGKKCFLKVQRSEGVRKGNETGKFSIDKGFPFHLSVSERVGTIIVGYSGENFGRKSEIFLAQRIMDEICDYHSH